MSRFDFHPNGPATEANLYEKFPNVPTSGLWKIAYGKDHTDMAYFIEFIPLDDVAKEQCTVSYNGQEGPDDEPAPKSEWEYNPLSFDCLWTKGFNYIDWVNILNLFGCNVLF